MTYLTNIMGTNLRNSFKKKKKKSIHGFVRVEVFYDVSSASNGALETGNNWKGISKIDQTFNTAAAPEDNVSHKQRAGTAC